MLPSPEETVGTGVGIVIGVGDPLSAAMFASKVAALVIRVSFQQLLSHHPDDDEGEAGEDDKEADQGKDYFGEVHSMDPHLVFVGRGMGQAGCMKAETRWQTSVRVFSQPVSHRYRPAVSELCVLFLMNACRCVPVRFWVSRAR